MAYEVTKRIKGRDYRYRVEAYRDPESGKRRARWHYLGAIAGGELVPAVKSRRARVTREDLVRATVRLLEHRDPANVTVPVIVRTAGTSLSTFYRHFGDRNAAFSVAFDRICDEVLRALPSLDPPLASRDAARERLRAWCTAYHRSMLQQRAMHWWLAQGAHGHQRTRIERTLITVDSTIVLTAFLRALEEHGFANVGDASALAHAVRGILLAMLFTTASELAEREMHVPTMDEALLIIDRAVFGS
jgi:AcrR family transcriptional regulator